MNYLIILVMISICRGSCNFLGKKKRKELIHIDDIQTLMTLAKFIQKVGGPILFCAIQFLFGATWMDWIMLESIIVIMRISFSVGVSRRVKCALLWTCLALILVVWTKGMVWLLGMD